MKTFKTLPNTENTFHDLLGYTFREWRDGYVELELEVLKKHRNRQGWIHGGVILSLLDIASTFAGNHSEDGPTATVTMNMSCNFIAGTQEDIIRTEGNLIRRGRSTYFTENRVFEDSSGKILATAQGVHKIL
jgi:uncharacterized protein (TIGR00369 family)